MTLAERAAAEAERDLKRVEQITGRNLRQAAATGGITEKPAWPPAINAAAFHGLAGEVARAIEPHTEADPGALLVQFHTAFGSIIGRTPYYLVEADKHFSNLFAVLVGDTSKSRKGTSWGHVRRLFAMVDDAWASTCVHSGLSSGEGLIWAVRDPATEDDTGIADKRLLIQESEFANVLRVMERDGNTLSRVIRDAWDRGDLAAMTKNSPARATGAHVSIVGHITADELRRYLTRTESANGFANRFLFFCVHRSKCLPHGGSLDEVTLKPLAKRLALAIGDAKRIGCVTMSSRARDAWATVYTDLSEGEGGLLGAVTGRAEAQCIRLALLYALADGCATISEQHLCAALALWEYAEASAAHIFGTASGDLIAETIMVALRAAPDGLSRTEINAALGRNQSAARIVVALRFLQDAGRANAANRDSTDGRPAEIWRAC